MQPIEIILDNIGKQYNQTWLFKNLSKQFSVQAKTAILGFNGSGKSTLLQIIAGFITPNKGSVKYLLNNKQILNENMFEHIALTAPYYELIEEFTVLELINHSATFKPFLTTLNVNQVLELSELQVHQNKEVKNLSSGLKQRLKLSLAILSRASVLLLDEPTSNLDVNAINWYQKLLKQYAKNKTVFICSNSVPADYFDFCNEELLI